MFLIYTWAQVVHEPGTVISEIADTYRRKLASAGELKPLGQLACPTPTPTARRQPRRPGGPPDR